jgi:outer membrane beta-barrel protein
MKKIKFINFLILPSLIWMTSGSAALAASTRSVQETPDLSEDIDSLGGNQELLEMARKIKSETRSRIVQERLVSRNNKLEVGLSYGGVLGGDAYLKTQSASVQLDYHITPRWSLGARYIDYGNSLTNEGQRVFDQARKNYQAGATGYAVDIDYPLNAKLAVLNWYPIYGKTSFLDMGINQFDVYLLAGGGAITLSSQDTSLFTAGAGIALWMTKHLTARAELRYQAYEDQPVTGSRQLDVGAATIGIGWIL